MYRSHLRIIAVCKYPYALPHVVEYQAGLYERPAAHYVFLAYVAHVCVKRFGSRRAEEHASEYHESCFVARAEKNLYSIDRVKRPDDRKIAERKPYTGKAKI